MKNNGLLLDTHAWIWIVTGLEKMAKGSSRKVVEKAFIDETLMISAISLWELSMLEAKGRLALSEPCLDWIQHSIEKLKLEVVPISPEVAVESTRLPGGFHGDPADRIIVATARKNRFTLLTQDELILSYAQQGLVNSLKCY
ncbi:type II toxin-antitoxin system VapC family toxin [Bdellovibrio sp. HCB-110]|uniref:type II toxin-antitoxin system VapC family toxin n=1 Tax=Bdellovibrio sp. HCB-110 TaxID=3391182 RepID=UPI0039B629F8